MTVALAALLATVAFGCANLIAWARGLRRRALILGHLLFALGGVAALLVALRQSDAPEADPSRALARVALGLLAFALVTGLVAPRLRNAAAANLALAVHFSTALVGVFVALSLRGGF